MSNEFPIKPAKYELSVEQQNAQIVAEALASLESLNEGQRGSRRVTPNSARQVVLRSIAEHPEDAYSTRRHHAFTALSHFVTLVQKNKTVELSAKNTDLLPVAHPLSTKPHAIAPNELSRMQSRWYADDSRITDPLVAGLLASAFASAPNSPEREYSLARLSAMGTSEVPSEVLLAALGFNDGANDGFWRQQLRDWEGRFAFMGGGLSVLVRLADGIVRRLSGRTVSSNATTKQFVMELPDGRLVRTNSSESKSVKALLPSEQKQRRIQQGSRKVRFK